MSRSTSFPAVETSRTPERAPPPPRFPLLAANPDALGRADGA
ncbi:hypothetical protein [Sphaerisporangium sp. NPDC051011]